MAYTMTHILVAEEVQQHFKKKMDYATYILGTIAPDAVHASSKYNVKLKERSHLFSEGLRWGEITNEIQSQVWLENIKKYYINNREKYNADFLLGYIVHLLVDVYCSIKFYAPFINTINDDYDKKVDQYKRESYIVNYYLFSAFSVEKNLYKILCAGEAVTLINVISREIIEQRIEQLFEDEFNYWDISHIGKNSICKKSDMEHVIQGASMFVKEIFIDNYYSGEG